MPSRPPINWVHILAYGAMGISTLATGAFSLLCYASSLQRGGCGNTGDAIRTALYFINPLGVLLTFGIWRFCLLIGALHPIGRTLSYLSLAFWVMALFITRT